MSDYDTCRWFCVMERGTSERPRTLQPERSSARPFSVPPARAFSHSDTSDDHGEACEWAPTTMRQRKSRVNLERHESTYAAVLPGPVHHRLVVSRVFAQRKRRTCQLKLVQVRERSVLHALCPESGPGLRASRVSSPAPPGLIRVVGHDIWQLFHPQAAVLSNIFTVLLQVRIREGGIGCA